jgi:hypothetical protein
MEFYRIVEVNTDEQALQDKITLDNLGIISNDLFVIGEQNNIQAEIGGVWGEFTLTRAVIKGGVRFTLVECSNALAWTVTTGFSPDPDAIILHLTINRKVIKDSFSEEINEFLDDQTDCLKGFNK